MADKLKTLLIFIQRGLPTVWPLGRCRNIHGQRLGLGWAWGIQWDLARQRATRTGYWAEDGND